MTMSNLKPNTAQQEAITTLDNNIAVAAGAGSGKTRVLVNRFLEIVDKDKASADNILAITFTRKAAKEMRERLRKAFLEKGVGAKGAERDKWQKQLVLLDRAQITTIDSFCNKVLRENPVEAHVDPNFVVRAEYELEEFKAEAIENFMEDGLAQGKQEFLDLVYKYGPQKFAAALNDFENILPAVLKSGALDAPYQPLPHNEEDLAREAMDCFQDLLSVADQAGAKTKSAILALGQQEDVFDDLLAQKEYDRLLDLCSSVPNTGKVKGQVQNLRESVKALLQCTYDRTGLAFAQAWQKVLTDFQTYYTKALEEQEYYSFSYISSKAVELLKQYPYILQKYRNKYSFIMVDEFQDTNEEQKELVYLLAGGSADALQDKRLFVVGDAKQSIYRFRGADVSVFKQVRDDITAKQGLNIVMSDNYRSTPQIMAACNCLFRDLLGSDTTADVSAQDLKANHEDGPKPEMAVILNEEKGSYPAKLAEARLVAKKIKEIVEGDDSLTYADVAILVPVINVAERFGEALAQEGIASCITDGKGFYEKQEIIDCLNFFTFGLNTKKDVALAGILRSPYLGVNDVLLSDLFAQAQETDQSLWQVMLLSEQPVLKAAAQKLSKLVQTVRTLSLTEGWDTFYEVFQVETTLLGQAQGQEKLANVDKLRKMAVDYALQEGGSLTDFLDRLALLREINAREQAATVVQSSDAVNIMTIHKSKGLEFPVVCLPSLQVRDKNDTAAFRFLSTMGLGLKVPDNYDVWQETSVYKAVKEENDRLERAEKIRQLYVAMTRAEKYLVMSTVKNVKTDAKEKDHENWFDSLERVFTHSENDTLVNWQEYAVDEVPPGAGLFLQDKPIQVPPATYDRIKPLLTEELFGETVFSATALQEYDSCPRRFFYSIVGKMPPLEEEKIGSHKYVVSPQTLGIVVHKALELKQQVPMEEALNRAVRDQELSSGEQGRLEEVARELLAGYSNSSIYKEIENVSQEAEKAFNLPLLNIQGQEIAFTGSIDRLLHYEDNTLGIVDFKTGHPPLNGEEKQGYTRQLVIYALAVEKLLGQKVKKAQLHFLQNNTAWVLPDNRQEEESKLQKLMTEILQKKSEQDFKVQLTNCQYCPYAYFCKKR
jgi:ATP-dependent helicase/nuclease subunit A